MILICQTESCRSCRTDQYALLPEQKITIRTVHTLQVSIAPESGSVILENFLGPTGDSIPFEELTFNGMVDGEALVLPPGGVLDYSREMTGGVSFTFSALEKDAEARVVWDGVEAVVSLPKGSTTTLEMDPASVGRPSTTNLILWHLVKWNEWVFLFLSANGFLGLIYLWAVKRDFQYQVMHQSAQRYLVDYLILAAILTLFAIILRAYRPDSVTKSILLVFPGLCYLILKILYRIIS